MRKLLMGNKRLKSPLKGKISNKSHNITQFTHFSVNVYKVHKCMQLHGHNDLSTQIRILRYSRLTRYLAQIAVHQHLQPRHLLPPYGD